MSIAKTICYVALFLVSFYYSLKEGGNVKEVIKIETQMKRTQEDITKTKEKDRYVR